MNRTQHKAMVGRNLAQIAAIFEREKALSNKEFAESIDAGDKVFSNWVRGKNYPDTYAVYLMFKNHGVTADWIYCSNPAGLPHWIAKLIKPDPAVR